MSKLRGLRGKVQRTTNRRRYQFAGMRFASDMEPGQAMVLIVLLVVLLLGIAALAIDGGGVMYLQRDAKNAADAAALAAARWKCTHPSETSPYSGAVSAGTTAATQNGFTTGQNKNMARNVTVEILVGSDFASEPILPTGITAANYAVVRIKAEKMSYFAHLVTKTPLAVTVSSSAKCSPGSTFSNVGAMVGYGTGCGDAQVNWQGSNATICGGITSSDGCTFNGSVGNPSTICGGVTSATASCDYNGVTTDSTTGNAAPISDPLALLWNPNDWAPGTAIERAASSQTCAAATLVGGETNDCYHTVMPAQGQTLEGVYYITGPVAYAGQGIQFGPNGATIVINNTATGTFNTSGPFRPDLSTTATEVKPYSLPTSFFSTTPPGFTADEVAYLKKMMYPNWLLLMTNWHASNICAASGAGIQMSMSSTFKGVFYASDSGCKVSFSNIDVAFGAVICAKIDFSGSDMNLLWDPTVLPAIDPGESQGS